MPTPSLTDMLQKLLAISEGDIDTLSQATEEFTRNITQEAQIPPEPGMGSKPSPPTSSSAGS